ncbi:MAG: cytochrome c biogenesis protein CcsA, partial [Spirochaetota bacterium]|nr:cytochrome c biogenesis protein CcsA [Spirochaetota bacterium]
LSRVSTALFIVALAVNIVLFIFQWITMDRLPVRTLYEALIYLTITLSLIYIIFEQIIKIKVIGVLSLFLILTIFIYAIMKRDADEVMLPPALQTWVFIPHTISYIAGYGGMVLAFIYAVLTLLLPNGIKGFWVISNEETTDFKKYSYPIVKFSFVFITMGFLLGAFWGHLAWGTYWGWDPKENWALISWFSQISYFHFKYIKNWSDRKLAWVIIICCLVIAFTFLGMNLLPKDVRSGSAHIYIED